MIICEGNSSSLINMMNIYLDGGWTGGGGEDGNGGLNCSLKGGKWLADCLTYVRSYRNHYYYGFELNRNILTKIDNDDDCVFAAWGYL